MSNLTGRPVTPKGIKRTKTNKPTQAQYAMWNKMREYGCIICRKPKPEIHHIETSMGCKKNHDRVIPLCVMHHRSKAEGLHGIGRKAWEEIYGTEQELLDKIIAFFEKTA